MKYVFTSVLLMLVVSNGAFAAARPAMSNKIMAAPQRYTASVNQLNGTPSAELTKVQSHVEPVVVEKVEEAEPDNSEYEAKRNACMNNNIGFGNTFVWASKYSDTSNYATMVEDTANPQNNVCFVRVDLRSDDESRISVSDMKSKYFKWGENIECGSWADKNVIEKRILDAKKGNRVGGVVAVTVASAGIGVGAMELFGNKLIGGKVEGQKNKKLEEDAVYRSQLLTLSRKDYATFQKYIKDLKDIKKACEDKTSFAAMADYCEEQKDGKDNPKWKLLQELDEIEETAKAQGKSK